MDAKRELFKSISTVNMRRFEMCILAGGLSSRMGRDKSRLRLGGRTLLARIRATAKVIGLPHRIIRRDLVANCGPLGGLYTALSVVESQLEKRAFSLQQLTQALRSQTIRLAARQARELFNVNTPEDLRKARALWRDRRPGNA